MSDVPSNLIPTRITQLPDAPVASPDGLLLFVYQGNNYKVRAGDLLEVAGVPTSRQVLAGSGMSGGGALSSDVTLSVASKGVNAALLSDTGVAAGSYGGATDIPVFTVDSTGRVTSAGSIPLSVSGFVPVARQIIAGTGLLGGGALSANVTLAANFSDSTPRVGFQSGLPGTATSMSRNDHQHPTVDLSDDDQVDNILGLANGGTAKSLVMNPGAVIWSGADGLYVSAAGAPGQVFVSNGTAAPSWGSALLIVDQPANVIYAGPASGPDANTAFRYMVNADLPQSTVDALTYGSSSQVGQFTVNSKGVLTFAGNVNISASDIGAIATVAGTANEITSSGTQNITLSLPSALTFTGKTVTGGAFNIASATIGADVVTTNTASQTLTAKTISGASNTFSNIGNAALTNNSVTYNGVTVALGAAGTITATATNALTISTGLLGTSYNGSAAVSISIDSTVATLTGTQTLTAKTISGASNTLTDIPNSSLVNTSVTYGSTTVALGGSSAILGGLTSVAVTQDPINALELATKQYVDAAVSNLNIHAPVQAGTIIELVATYNNGTSGVGATLTNSGTLAAFTTDGYSAALTDRILVKDQTNAANNGVYTVTTLGSGSVAWVLTRATDYDTSGSSSDQISPGDYLFIQRGTTLSATGWVQTTPQPITVGTTPIEFSQFSGAGTYTAGTGLTLVGTLFSLADTAVVAATYGSASTTPVMIVNAQGQLTSVVDTAVAIANTAVSGLGTMSTQAASAVAITGGTINGATVGATTAASGKFTTLTATTGLSGGVF